MKNIIKTYLQEELKINNNLHIKTVNLKYTIITGLDIIKICNTKYKK